MVLPCDRNGNPEPAAIRRAIELLGTQWVGREELDLHNRALPKLEPHGDLVRAYFNGKRDAPDQYSTIVREAWCDLHQDGDTDLC